ncbi:MAG: hypothetical protein WC080_00055 [Patescibacteria group bacterium]|jgi:hypothetical protein
MAKEKCELKVSKGKGSANGIFGGAYGLAFIGAAVYFIQQADTFWWGVLGFLKAIVWPALLIYKVFTLLHM